MNSEKVYEYTIDNGFIKGQTIAHNEKEVRRFLRKLLGLKLYLRVRKIITIKKVQG